MPPNPFLHPRLRPLDIRRIEEQGRPFFMLRDPLGLNQQMAIVPQELGPFLALCDGTRDCSAIASIFSFRTDVQMTPDDAAQVVETLSQALLLEDARFTEALGAATNEYRSRPYREPALAGKAYPADPKELSTTFDRYCAEAPRAEVTKPGRVTGIISPHIDYNRGWPVYAGVWGQAAEAIAETDLAVVFGTDHSGGAGTLTLTRQHYATPWGTLPTATPIVDALAKQLGEQAVFEEELHHRNEHSIELAVTWLHYFLKGRPCEVVPILCGSFHEFVMGEVDPAAYERFEQAMTVLREAAGKRRTLVIAAADLAHVGPAFGDPEPWRDGERLQLRQADDALLGAIGQGNATQFFEHIRQVGDNNRVCGMPPIYLTLRALGASRGVSTGYDQCPADEDGGSLVSIAGAVLFET
ncbi:MAG: AmmeMemoRadiSam system protein B [Chloroflexi bacterium]|nr:AmmeMemoRadiSam system protein B [Chloroflexota bacterium]